MSPQIAEARAETPYDRIGGDAVIRRVVDRFYDLMDTDPGYAALRGLHAPDLSPMHASLSGFLVGWLGGPRDWFARNPGVCVMSVHARIAVTQDTARQWVQAMSQALEEAGVERDLRVQIATAFSNMAAGMAARGH